MLYDFNALKELFLSYLKAQKFEDEPLNLHEPINYIMDLGGKRIRPVSVLIGYNIFDEKVENALPLAYAMEMFHNFTLAHDDVMDDADMRRGKASMHIKYSLNNAVLSGDAMLIYAYKYIQESSNDLPLMNNILTLFSDTAIDICAGQQMDMDFEEMDEVELSSYLLMIKLKTAVLLAACLKAGALLAGADEDNAAHLYSYGLNLGLAFQIRDDVLDLYGQGFGKKKGGDIIQKKKSFLILKALEECSPQEKSDLLALYNSDDIEAKIKVKKVQSYFDKLQIKEQADALMEELTENAMDHLSSIKIEKNKLLELQRLGELLLKRKN